MSRTSTLVQSGQGKPTMSEVFSIAGVFTTKRLVIMALLLAVRTILGLPFLTIYVAGIKLVTLAYIPDAVCGMLFGPWAGLVFGFAGDTLGFLSSMGSGGGYVPFYAISEMATCFIFAMFLYKRELKLSSVVIAWAINLVLVVLGMNTVWLMLLAGMKAGQVLTLLRFGINLLQFPVHILITWVVLKQLKRIRYLSDERIL
jgi:ECF transporter S component (folate family)